MSSIYRFSIRSLRHPGLSRVVELTGQDTLGELQAVIVREFRLDWDHAWAFWLGGEWHERELEYGGSPAESGRADITSLERLGLEPGDLLAHAHDFGETRRHLVTVLAVSQPEPGIAYPRVVERVGQAPSYYGEEEELEVSPPSAPQVTAPFAAPLLAALDASLQRWERGAPYQLLDDDPAGLARLALEVLEACDSPARLAALSRRSPAPLAEWMEDAARTLGLRGQPDAAVAIATRLACWRGVPDPLLDLAGELVEADPSKHPSARTQFKALLEAATAIPEWRSGAVELAWARLQIASGDPTGAESRLRALSGRRHLATEERSAAIEALADLLGSRGEGEEAARLGGQAAKLKRRRAELVGGTVRNAGPQVGRNDPCPCGSGKKFKKCCGG